MFDAGMKIKVVKGSIEHMEVILFGEDAKEPMKAI
jgi:hypothetical protein